MDGSLTRPPDQQGAVRHAGVCQMARQLEAALHACPLVLLCRAITKLLVDCMRCAFISAIDRSP